MISLSRAELKMLRSIFKQFLMGAYQYWDDNQGIEVHSDCISLEDEEIDAMLGFCKKIFSVDELKEIVDEVDV